MIIFTGLIQLSLHKITIFFTAGNVESRWMDGGQPGAVFHGPSRPNKGIGRRGRTALAWAAVDPISGRIDAVRERVSAALQRSGRERGAVTIVAVTKTFGADMVRRVIAAGITDIGENRVQEMVAKAAEVDAPCRWHLVGPLQRNKAGKAAALAHLIHAVDGVPIAQTLDRIARERGTRVRVLLEVNTSGEATKHGVEPSAAPALADALAALPGVDWQGLMTIGPVGGDLEAARLCFQELRRLSDELRRRSGLALPELSMGMSDDFEVAIEEGATIIRVGRVVTGERG
jgi:pyridoxal phosphate enzyme (YggS family)